MGSVFAIWTQWAIFKFTSPFVYYHLFTFFTVGINDVIALLTIRMDVQSLAQSANQISLSAVQQITGLSAQLERVSLITSTSSSRISKADEDKKKINRELKQLARELKQASTTQDLEKLENRIKRIEDQVNSLMEEISKKNK